MFMFQVKINSIFKFHHLRVLKCLKRKKKLPEGGGQSLQHDAELNEIVKIDLKDKNK